MKEESKEVTEENFAFSIQTTADLLYYSLDMSGKEYEGNDLFLYDPSQLKKNLFSWRNSILALARAYRLSVLVQKEI